MSDWFAFINNNEVLFNGIFSLLCVIIGGIMGWSLKQRSENKKYKKENIKFLREEIEKVQNELKNANTRLEKYTSIEEMEKNIDKSTGTIYREKLSNGKIRYICGYCWEKKRIKIPINVRDISERGHKYLKGQCNDCGEYCEYEKDYDDLPF